MRWAFSSAQVELFSGRALTNPEVGLAEELSRITKQNFDSNCQCKPRGGLYNIPGKTKSHRSPVRFTFLNTISFLKDGPLTSTVRIYELFATR